LTGETADTVGFDWHLAARPRAVTLSNGLRLITVARPGTPTVAVRAYVRAGSRYDVEEQQGQSPDPPLGLAHLTEHLLFKGTRKRSQRQIFAAVERLGGALDGGTTREYATLSSVMPRPGLRAALHVLAELLSEPALREGDFWNEKLVVLEEIRRARDQLEVLYDLFAATVWQNHPFRFCMRGTPGSLRDLSHEALLRFYQERYVARNMVLVVCGDIAHEEVRQLARESFSSLPPGIERPPVPVEEPHLRGARTAHVSKDVGQTLLLLGVPTVSMRHEDRGPLKVAERVLGMGGSARLYQRLREEMRLVYGVRTVTAHYEDTGYLAVRTACHPQKVAQVQEAVLQEWEKLGQDGVSEDELSAAKTNYAGTQARRFETNHALAGIFGVECLLHRIETFEQALRRINAVDCEDVVRVAEKYLDPGRVVIVSVGRG
jgi:predicted Zn-dependent peptidase